MARAIDVADFIIQESSRNHKVTNLELQKYMYFCHARSLVERETPLIDDVQIEKWRYGPVIKSVYHEYKHYGTTPISSPDTHFDMETFETVEFDEERLTPNERNIIRDTIPTLNNFDGFKLVEETHRHAEWKNSEDKINAGKRGLVYSNKGIVIDFLSNKKFRLWAND